MSFTFTDSDTPGKDSFCVSRIMQMKVAPFNWAEKGAMDKEENKRRKRDSWELFPFILEKDQHLYAESAVYDD